MNLYTADLHFGHKNIIRLDGRPFADVEEMDRVLIKSWNDRVQPEDVVYVLGDVCFRNKKPTEWYLNQLKGHKILITGNHDDEILGNPVALRYFEQVEQIMSITDKDHKLCLCHYPMAEWPGYCNGTWHIYGHIHCQKNTAYEFMKSQSYALNAGCMINNYMPVSLEELVKNNEAFQKKRWEPLF